MLLYIIRHGDPTYNPDALTPLGKRQAEAVARRLSVHGVDEVYTSPLMRARQTAQPTCEILHKEAKVAEWASEGFAWEYFTFEDENWDNRQNWVFGVQNTIFKTEENLSLGDRWYEAYPFCRSKAKEGWEILKKNSDDFTESLGYKREGMIYKITQPSEKRIAVFCHAGFGSVWLSHLLAIPPVLFWSAFDMNHTGITILHFENHANGYTAPKCLAYSDISHIYGDRLPLKFANGIDI